MSAIFFNWPTAKHAGLAGYNVRRKDWTTKWWKYSGGFWWVVTAAETRVVKNTDFTRKDLLALDWTNLSPDCVTAQQDAQGAAGNCAVFSLDSAPATPESTPTGGSTENTGGATSGGTKTYPNIPSNPSDGPAPGTDASNTTIKTGAPVPPIPEEPPEISLSATTDTACVPDDGKDHLVRVRITISIAQSDNPKYRGLYYLRIAELPGIFPSIYSGGSYTFITKVASSDFTYPLYEIHIPKKYFQVAATHAVSGNLLQARGGLLLPFCGDVTETVEINLGDRFPNTNVGFPIGNYGAYPFGPYRWPAVVVSMGDIFADDDLVLNGIIIQQDNLAEGLIAAGELMALPAGERLVVDVRNASAGGPCFATGTLCIVPVVPQPE